MIRLIINIMIISSSSIMFIIGLYMIFSKYNDRSKKILNLYSLFHKLEVFSDEDFKKNFQEISRILGLSIIIEAIFLLSIYSSIYFIGYSLEYLGILIIFVYIGIRMYLSSKINQIKKIDVIVYEKNFYINVINNTIKKPRELNL